MCNFKEQDIIVDLGMNIVGVWKFEREERVASLLVDIRGRESCFMPTRIYAHDKMLLEFLIICAHIIIMSTYLHCYYYHHLICLLFWCCSRKEAMSLVCSNQSQKLKLKQKEQQNRKEEDTKDTSLPFFALFLIYKEKQDRGEN